MYTWVTAWRTDAAEIQMHGHIYDISEQGVRIELDEPLSPGDAVDLHLSLPGAANSLGASADVVWVHNDEDDPGPRRMALKFTGFLQDADHDRLVDYLKHEDARRAA